MAQYAILIYEHEASWAGADPETRERIYGAHQKFMADHAAAVKGGDALQPTSTATSLRATLDGEVTVTDGPFAETKEALGGFYLIEAADLDAALAVAREVPAEFGGVEVRPIMTFE